MDTIRSWSMLLRALPTRQLNWLALGRGLLMRGVFTAAVGAGIVFVLRWHDLIRPGTARWLYELHDQEYLTLKGKLYYAYLPDSRFLGLLLMLLTGLFVVCWIFRLLWLSRLHIYLLSILCRYNWSRTMLANRTKRGYITLFLIGVMAVSLIWLLVIVALSGSFLFVGLSLLMFSVIGVFGMFAVLAARAPAVFHVVVRHTYEQYLIDLGMHKHSQQDGEVNLKRLAIDCKRLVALLDTWIKLDKRVTGRSGDPLARLEQAHHVYLLIHGYVMLYVHDQTEASLSWALGLIVHLTKDVLPELIEDVERTMVRSTPIQAQANRTRIPFGPDEDLFIPEDIIHQLKVLTQAGRERINDNHKVQVDRTRLETLLGRPAKVRRYVFKDAIPRDVLEPVGEVYELMRTIEARYDVMQQILTIFQNWTLPAEMAYGGYAESALDALESIEKSRIAIFGRIVMDIAVHLSIFVQKPDHARRYLEICDDVFLTAQLANSNGDITTSWIALTGPVDVMTEMTAGADIYPFIQAENVRHMVAALMRQQLRKQERQYQLFDGLLDRASLEFELGLLDTGFAADNV